MDLRAVADGCLALGAADPRLLVMDRSGSVLWQAEPSSADFRGQRDQLRISPDGALVRFGFERFGKLPARFDLSQRRLDADSPPDPALAAARITGLDIKDWENTVHPTLVPNGFSSKPLELKQYETSRSLAIAPAAGSFLLGTEWSLRRFDAAGALLWRMSTPGVACAVNITADGRIAVAAYGDGTIRWHRMTDGGELLAFFPHRDRHALGRLDPARPLHRLPRRRGPDPVADQPRPRPGARCLHRLPLPRPVLPPRRDRSGADRA